jgi:hypothetical protein
MHTLVVSQQVGYQSTAVCALCSGWVNHLDICCHTRLHCARVTTPGLPLAAVQTMLQAHLLLPAMLPLLLAGVWSDQPP